MSENSLEVIGFDPLLYKIPEPSEGPRGVGVATLGQDTNGHLIVTLTDGTTFDAGAMRGMSAYDAAVENGFVGAVGDWLASLVGPASTVPGPANTLSIGSVTTGGTPSVTISGDAPTQVLSFVLPNGGSGSVTSVAGVADDGTGNVPLTASDIGAASLVGGVVPTAQIPAIALTVPFVVADETAMLALTAQQGDIAIRSDNSTAYMLAADGDPTVLADWIAISTPGGVTSINGQVGVVVLNAANVGALATASNLSDLANAGTARTNLGLGDSATKNVGTAAGSVAAGNDSRFSGLTTTTQSSTYTLAAADAGTVVEITASSATTVTVPVSVFTAGQMIEVSQHGAGQVTLAAGSGVTLRTAGSLKTRAQYSSLFLRFRSATEAVVSGDME